MTQAQIPWEGVPVLRCFSGKRHLLKYLLPSFPVSRYLCPNPAQPGTGVHYIYIPSPSPHRLLLSALLFLSLPTTTTSQRRPPFRRNTLRPVFSKEQSSHTSSTSLGSIHLCLHALCRHQCPLNPGLSTASSRIDLDQYHTPHKYHRLISTSSDGHFSAAAHSILGDDSNSTTLRVHPRTNCAHAHRDTIATRF